MKKKQLFPSLVLVLSLVPGTVTSQDLYVGAGGVISITSGDALYVNSNLSVDVSGSLTVNSNATNSASLLVSGSVTGNIRYVRYIPSTNWHLVSAPVSGQSIPAFVADINNGLTTNGSNGNIAVAYYKNDNATGLRWTYYNATPSAVNQEAFASFTNGQGYSTNRTAVGNYTFTGGMATTDVAVSLTTASGAHHWSCIGNPYPSFLPANSSAASTNILGQNIAALDPSYAALYFWNGSAFEIVNNISASLFLAPGQAFMVRARDESETFTFTESLQSHQSSATTFKRTNTTMPEVVVSLLSGNQTKTTAIKYLSNATTGLDVGYDAGAYYDGIPSFSLDTHLVSDSQGIDFTLQCLPNSNYETMVVPLSVRSGANTSLSFSATESNLPQGLDVYLEDREHNTFTKINETAYQVTPAQALAGIGRFYLHTTSSVLSTDEVTGIESISIYKTDNTNLRITGLQDSEWSTLKMYSITGQEVMVYEFRAQSVSDIPLSRSLRIGIYIATLVSGDKHCNKKMIIE